MLKLKCLYAEWLVWCSMSTNRSIFGAMLLVAILTVVVKLVAMLKEMLLANIFGVSDELDAFLMAFLLPSFAVSVFAGSFPSSFIPTLFKIKESQNKIEVRQLLSLVSFYAFTVLLFVTGLLYVIKQILLPLIASSFSEQKLTLTIQLFSWLVFYIPIAGMSLFLGSVLNIEKKFALVAFTPAITSLTIIGVLYLSSTQIKAIDLVNGTLIGSTIELCIIIWAVHKQGYLCLIPIGNLWNKNIKHILSQYFPMIGGAFLMSGTVVIDQVMASWLDSGSIASLNYANKIPALITGLATTALGTALLPYLSQLVAKYDFLALKNTFFVYTKIIFLLAIPVTLIVFLFSKELVQLLFQRGAFNQNTSNLVAWIQQLYLLQIPFYIFGTLGARLISSFSKNYLLAWIAAFNLAFNIVGNYFFVQFFGIAGIALSTSIVQIVSSITIFIVLMKILNLKINKDLTQK